MLRIIDFFLLLFNNNSNNMNYIRNLINNMNWEHDIDDLFQEFVEEVNEVPFITNYHNTPEFQLNQRIIQNAYSLRRAIELYPQGDFLRQYRPSNRPSNRPNDRPNDRLNSTELSSPTPNIFTRNTNIGIDIESQINLNNTWPVGISRQILASLNLTNDITNNVTNNIFDSLINNFNQYIEENIPNFEDFNEFEDVKVTLSDEDFNKLDVVSNKEDIKNKQCNICLEDLKEDELNNGLIQLNCGHIYHRYCIKEWLTKQSTKCPSCRNCCKTNTSTSTSTE